MIKDALDSLYKVINDALDSLYKVINDAQRQCLEIIQRVEEEILKITKEPPETIQKVKTEVKVQRELLKIAPDFGEEVFSRTLAKIQALEMVIQWWEEEKKNV